MLNWKRSLIKDRAMNRRPLIYGILISAAAFMTGCGMFESRIPEMTEEEQELVVEYATETLLKYDAKNGGRIKHLDESMFKAPEVVIEGAETDENGNTVFPESEEPAPTPEPESLTVVDNPDVVEETDIIDNTGEGGSVFTSLEDTLGYSGVLSMEYAGYELDDYYPRDMSSYFVMNASNGCKLLVIKYNVTNISGSDADIAMPYGSIRYKVTLDGDQKNALSTLLLNDLASYRGTLAPGESTELVVVAEYKENELSGGVSSLSLQVKTESGTSDIKLE